MTSFSSLFRGLLGVATFCIVGCTSSEADTRDTRGVSASDTSGAEAVSVPSASTAMSTERTTDTAAECADGDDASCLALDSTYPSTGELVRSILQATSAEAAVGSDAPERCASGEGSYCAALAEELPERSPAAHRLHRLACAQDYWFSCNNLTVVFNDPLGAQISQRMFSAQCDSGSAAACYHAAAQLEAEGGNAADFQRVYGLMTRSCNLGYGTACYSLAWVYATGLHGMVENIEHAYRLLVLACDRGSPDACSELNAPPRELRVACRGGDPMACRVLEMR